MWIQEFYNMYVCIGGGGGTVNIILVLFFNIKYSNNFLEGKVQILIAAHILDVNRHILL